MMDIGGSDACTLIDCRHRARSCRRSSPVLRRNMKGHMNGGVSEGVAMATQDDSPSNDAELPLTAFELPKWLVEPAVRSCRLFNTALDFELNRALLESPGP
jgi:hypothetical protein